MNTGTLISDLMATVERAEMRSDRIAGRSAEQRHLLDEWELNRIYGLQSTTNQHQRVFMGAA